MQRRSVQRWDLRQWGVCVERVAGSARRCRGGDGRRCRNSQKESHPRSLRRAQRRGVVPRTGIEPACPVKGASTSSWCVCQFRHLGASWGGNHSWPKPGCNSASASVGRGIREPRRRQPLPRAGRAGGRGLGFSGALARDPGASRTDFSAARADFFRGATSGASRPMAAARAARPCARCGTARSVAASAHRTCVAPVASPHALARCSA